MKVPRLCLFVVGLVVLASLGTLLTETTKAQQAQLRAELEWEYKVVDVMTAFQAKEGGEDNNAVLRQLEAFLNEQGRGGWELVSYARGAAVYKRDATK